MKLFFGLFQTVKQGKRNASDLLYPVMIVINLLVTLGTMRHNRILAKMNAILEKENKAQVKKIKEIIQENNMLRNQKTNQQNKIEIMTQRNAFLEQENAAKVNDIEIYKKENAAKAKEIKEMTKENHKLQDQQKNYMVTQTKVFLEEKNRELVKEMEKYEIENAAHAEEIKVILTENHNLKERETHQLNMNKIMARRNALLKQENVQKCKDLEKLKKENMSLKDQRMDQGNTIKIMAQRTALLEKENAEKFGDLEKYKKENAAQAKINKETMQELRDQRVQHQRTKEIMAKRNEEKYLMLAKKIRNDRMQNDIERTKNKQMETFNRRMARKNKQISWEMEKKFQGIMEGQHVYELEDRLAHLESVLASQDQYIYELKHLCVNIYELKQ